MVTEDKVNHSKAKPSIGKTSKICAHHLVDPTRTTEYYPDVLWNDVWVKVRSVGKGVKFDSMSMVGNRIFIKFDLGLLLLSSAELKILRENLVINTRHWVGLKVSKNAVVHEDGVLIVPIMSKTDYRLQTVF